MTFNSDTLKRLRNGLILLIIGTVLFIWADIWTDLRNYDLYTPDVLVSGFCDELRQQSSKGSCEKLLREYGYYNSHIPISDSGKYLAEAAADKDISYVSSEQEDGVYIISVDETELIRIVVNKTGEAGLLNLPEYGVTSVNGLVTADYVVSHPDQVYVGGAALTSMSPLQTGYILDDFTELHRTLPDIKVPDHYVYRFVNLFKALPVTGTGSEMKIKELSEGRIYVMDNMVNADEAITETAESFNRDYLYFLSGDIQWDSFKGDVLSTAPLFSRIQPREGELFARQVSSYVKDFKITECCKWTNRIMSLEAECTYVIQSPDGDISFPVDNIYYIYYCDDSRWRLCELKELSAVPVINPAEEDGSDD